MTMATREATINLIADPTGFKAGMAAAAARLRPPPRPVDLAFQTQMATRCLLAPNRQRGLS